MGRHDHQTCRHHRNKSRDPATTAKQGRVSNSQKGYREMARILPAGTWKVSARYIQNDEYYASVSMLGDGTWAALVSPYDGTGTVNVGYYPTSGDAMIAVEEYLPAVVGVA